MFHDVCRASAFDGIALDPNVVAEWTPDQLFCTTASKGQIQKIRRGKYQTMSAEELIAKGILKPPPKKE